MGRHWTHNPESATLRKHREFCLDEWFMTENGKPDWSVDRGMTITRFVEWPTQRGIPEYGETENWQMLDQISISTSIAVNTIQLKRENLGGSSNKSTWGKSKQ
ncbi:hypothetical protein BDV26DRAFT_11248 [Aspergillus bertholletiae]|uniref:Uncharacterized protein n=1 Tax=Aspergillus bertholletiae TaxID=1226010 RepID=A0A5N7B0K1_9EURO|nr:hypothetical protein BDV26DRAFT_11248 [Aspergillus bertholletiae]